MESTLSKIERLIEQIDAAPVDGTGTIARLHGTLDEVEARLREYLRETTPVPDPAPVPTPRDGAGWMGEEARRIGHDLNNHLGVVGGRAELMLLYLDRGRLDDVRRGIEVILGQMDRLRELSEELRGLRHGPGGAP